MKYLLDTNILIYLKDPYSKYYDIVGRNFLRKLTNDAKVYVSLLTLYEVEVGVSLARTSQVKDLMQNTIELIETHFQVLPLTREEAKLFGDLKAVYLKAYGMKPKAAKRDDIDLILASTAIMEDAVLVSNDSLFGKLQNLNSNLQYENWTIDDVGVEFELKQ